MQLTPCHAKYFAYELTKRCSSNSLEKLAASLSDDHSFMLRENPFPNEKKHSGPYRIGKNIEDPMTDRCRNKFGMTSSAQVPECHPEPCPELISGLFQDL